MNHWLAQCEFDEIREELLFKFRGITFSDYTSPFVDVLNKYLKSKKLTNYLGKISLKISPINGKFFVTDLTYRP